MKLSDMETFLSRITPASSSVSSEHSYCNMYKIFSTLPPRSKTTEEERKLIKEWGLNHPNADTNQRKELARSMGLTNQTVFRLVMYANKKNGEL